MAEAPLSTKAPGGIPERGQVEGNLSNTLAPAAGNPTFASDPTYIDAVAKNNHALSTTLINDNKILVPGEYEKYENALRAGEGREQEGFERQGGQTMARGAANSGFALKGRQNLAARYQLSKNAAAMNFSKRIAGIQTSAANEAWRGQEGLINAGIAAEGRRAKEIGRTPNEAPPPPPQSVQSATQAAAGTKGEGGVLGYPKASAYLGVVFPGGPAEQVQFSKMSPAQKAQWEAQHRAKGGPVQPGKPYVVGEQGPEIMVPKTGGQILPNHAGPKAQQIRRRAIERLGRWNGGGRR